MVSVLCLNYDFVSQYVKLHKPFSSDSPHFFHLFQDCILLPCFFNFYAEYIMRNAGLEETQAGIKIAGRKINNLRYADDITLMAESQEDLEPLDESERRKWKS